MNLNITMKPIHILLVEDNEGDVLLTSEALLDAEICNELSVVSNGEDAINFMEKMHPFTHARQPDLVLLDVNLPRKNGYEVLQHIKSSEALKHIPVIMLTTSCLDKDIINSYRNHASRFICKPVEAETFLDVIAEIKNSRILVENLPKI